MKERISKNKGFTLIELLAVIVILAVIALIATPLIMRVINNARKNSSKDNAYGFVKAVEFSVATNMTDEEENFDGNYTIEGKSIKSEKKTLPVKYKGTPVSGELTIKNNTVESGIFKSGSYDVIYHDGIADVIGLANTTTAYADGTVLYFNPNTGTKCTQAEYTSNDGSATNKKTGCMRWYTFGDKTGNTSIKMILDHNAIARIRWNDSGRNVAYESSNLKTVLDDLVTTSGWKVTPRLITASEVNTITDKQGFDVSNVNNWYWLDTLTHTRATFSNSVRSSYDWLYNNLNKCKTDSIDYGCTMEDNNTYAGYGTALNGELLGYWTSTPVGSANSGSYVWYIDGAGALNYDNCRNSFYGIRPVITLSKSKLS